MIKIITLILCTDRPLDEKFFKNTKQISIKVTENNEVNKQRDKNKQIEEDIVLSFKKKPRVKCILKKPITIFVQNGSLE